MKSIQNFPNYSITEYGDVYNAKGLKLKKQVNVDGYFVVHLYNHKGRFYKRVCRLVAEAYLENYSEDLVVNHKDLNKQNDFVGNLEMVTTLENTLHSIRNQPEKHKARAVIDLKQAHKICDLISKGFDNFYIHSKLGVSKDIVCKIRSKKAWKDISANYNLMPSIRLVDEDTVREICKALIVETKPSKILKSLLDRGFVNISLDVIKDIKRGKTWKHISIEYLDKPSTTS